MGHTPERTADSNNTFIGTEAMVAAFVHLWRRGERPSIARFLGNVSGTRRTQLLVALINADLAERISREPTVTVEWYLNEFPELGPLDNLPLQLILTEYNARSAHGCQPDLSDYQRRFPQQIAALRSHLDGHATKESIPNSSNSLPLLPGTELGDFRIVRLLGQGGMSHVYLARQRSLDRLVALKASPCNDSFPRDEARTLAQLSHDHIVPVYVEQIAGDWRLIAMRYVPGVTLSRLMDGLEERIRSRCRGRDLLKLVDRGSLTEPDPTELSTRGQLARLKFVQAACHLVLGLARGLEHAHRHGVLHRDIKPANILVTQSGRAMLMDFNIASRAETIPKPNNSPGTIAQHVVVQASRLPGSQLTTAGGTPAPQDAITGGTPAYMAPEQLAAIASQAATNPAAIDARSDIYSLGVVFYELLSGMSPFDLPHHAGPIHVMAAQLLSARSQTPPPILRQAVRISPGLDSILEKCLAPEPAERYRSAGELAEDLERYVEHRPLRHAPDPSWGERAGKWLRRHPHLSAAAVTAFVLIMLGTVGEVCFEYRYLKQAEHLMDTAYLLNTRGDVVGAYEHVRQAELLLGKCDRLLPLLGFDQRHARIAGLGSFLSTVPFRRFQFYSSLARGGQSTASRSGEVDSPAIQALLEYLVLERPDWQKLPHFQALDPEVQAVVEALVTEMIIIRAANLVAASESKTGAATESDEGRSPPLNSDHQPEVSARQVGDDIAELLSRVPESQKNRYAVFETNRLARGIGRSIKPDDESEGESPSLARRATMDRPPLDRWDPFDLYLMGVLDAKLGRFESAVKYFDLVLARAADDDTGTRYWAQFHRAYCAEQSGDIDSAIAGYATCIGLDNQVAPYHNLGLIYARQEKFDLAAKYLREASRRGGNAIVSVLVNLAAVELKLGNLPQALDAANDAVQLDEHCADAYANRGAAHAAMGHSDTAIADLKRALELDPTCNAARQNLDLLQTGAVSGEQ